MDYYVVGGGKVVHGVLKVTEIAEEVLGEFGDGLDFGWNGRGRAAGGVWVCWETRRGRRMAGDVGWDHYEEEDSRERNGGE